MKLVNKETGVTYNVSDFSHGEIKFIHPAAGELIAGLVVKADQVYATYYCNLNCRVTARFDIIEPSAAILSAIENARKGVAKAAQEKAEARERFINQEDYK